MIGKFDYSFYFDFNVFQVINLILDLKVLGEFLEILEVNLRIMLKKRKIVEFVIVIVEKF